MPRIKSQIKRDKQNLKSAEINKSLKNKIKTLNKKVKSAIEKKDGEKAAEEMKTYFSALDKAAKTGTVHKNFSSNKKSQAAKLLNSMSSKPEAEEAKKSTKK
jgi:small subunit ribosomal protein S20